MAKKEGIDISLVPGTGKGGRVTKTDLIEYIKRGGQAQAAPQQTTHAAPGGSSAISGYTGPRIAPLTGISEDDS